MPQGKISNDNTRMSIVIPKDLKEKISTIANNENRSASNLIVNLIANYVHLNEQKTRLKAYHSLILELNDKDDSE